MDDKATTHTGESTCPKVIQILLELDVMQVGDEVRLHLPENDRYGMFSEHDGLWVRIVGIDAPVGRHFHMEGLTGYHFRYGILPHLHISGWRRQCPRK